MKKFLVISDLHFDGLCQKEGFQNLSSDFTRELIHFINTEEIEGLIIAGDISKEKGDVQLFFEALGEVDIPKIMVPGNHELFLDIDFNLVLRLNDI